ncbi:unnamed protein product [Brachionus calyciflorus]|uniref:Ubiquitin-like protease family profile domain-containing protein n=1 Tax=Brachionus calyciflorus TaxID=104777 RepID=A0A814IE19_9BILA|nr:unnamed protein product [Brachionus calyciflorus]
MKQKSYFGRFKRNKKAQPPPKWVIKELNSADYFLMPILLDDNHWSLVFIDTIKQKLTNLDSYYEPSQLVLDQIKNHFNNLLPKLNNLINWNSTEYKVPKQNNVTDCGVYLCLYSRYLCTKKKKFDFSQDHIPNLRKHIESEIRAGEIIKIDKPYF